MNKKANQQIRAEKLINIILLETTALLTKPTTSCSHSFLIAMLVLEAWLCYVLFIWGKQGLLCSYSSSVTYFLSQTAQGPNLHTRATQSALASCLSVAWVAHSPTFTSKWRNRSPNEKGFVIIQDAWKGLGFLCDFIKSTAQGLY